MDISRIVQSYKKGKSSPPVRNKYGTSRNIGALGKTKTIQKSKLSACIRTKSYGKTRKTRNVQKGGPSAEGRSGR